MIEREEKKIRAEAEYEVALTKAEEMSSVMQTKAEGEMSIAENKAKKTAVELINDAAAYSNRIMIQADERAKVAVIEAEAKLEATRSKYEALLKEGKAESQHASSLEPKRHYQLEMAKAEVLEKIAASGKMIISGAAGDSLLQSIVGSAARRKE